MNVSSSEERQSKVMDQTKSKQHKKSDEEKTNSVEGDEWEMRGCKLVRNNQNKRDRK